MYIKKQKYKVVLFLKNRGDSELLKPGLFLYGRIDENLKKIFLAPYKPSIPYIKKTAIIQPENNWCLASPLLVNLYFQNSKCTARAFLENEWKHLPVEIVYSSTLNARTPFKQAELDYLSAQKVLIFGAGSGGSKISVALASAGVGHITICDPQSLEWANVFRHEGDIRDIGKSKAYIAAEKIYWRNPSIKVECYCENIFDREHDFIENLFHANNLIIADTDDNAIQLLICEFACRHKRPFLSGGCYESARGGEVFYNLPGMNMPCLACLRSGLKQPSREANIDYSTADGPDDYQGQPGLHAMIDFITSPMIIISLAMLLRNIPDSQLGKLIRPDKNYLLIGGALGAGYYRFKKPFDVFYQPLNGPRKDCPVCGNVYKLK